MVDWDYLRRVLGVRDEVLQRLKELEIIVENIGFIEDCLVETEYYYRIKDFLELYKKLTELWEDGKSINDLLYDRWFTEKFNVQIDYENLVIETVCRKSKFYNYWKDCIEINVKLGNNEKEVVLDVLVKKVYKKLEELLRDEWLENYFYTVIGLSSCIKKIYYKVEELRGKYDKLLKQVEQLLKKG